jgi:NAD(P)H-nitrite reductase large subunit
MTTKKHHVIIGASAAGMAAASAILKNDPGSRVTVLSDEADPPYFRPLIPFIISGKKSPSHVALMGQGPYIKEGIDLRLNTRALAIDPGNRRVTTTAEPLFFDRLLIASGGAPLLPPEIEGTRMKGVYALRTLAQAREAALRSQTARRAVMIGGGLLNLKASFALLEKGVSVTLVVRSKEILSQLMEPDDALMIREALEGAGLKMITGASARRILSGGDGAAALLLDNGTELPAEMVFIGKGVRPAVDFLAGSGIDIDSGVVVNPYTETSEKGIFAAGDAAATIDPITGEKIVTGLWTNAVEMGLCAGKNMAGGKTAYQGSFGVMNATQVAGLPFVSMGLTHTGESGVEVHRTLSKTAYRKLVFSGDGRRLIGLVMIGDIEKAGLYRFIMRERRDILKFKEKIIRHTLSSADMMAG